MAEGRATAGEDHRGVGAEAGDCDRDGNPDDGSAGGQLVYRARTGIVANGERANRIYVERNVAAADAQFGISDWDPDGDGWAPYARTDGSNAFGTIVDVTATDLNGDGVAEPVVRIQHPSKGCRTLQPNRNSPTTHGENRRMVVAHSVPGTC